MTYPNQPQQPYNQQPWQPPQPPKKTGPGKILGIGCLGFLGLIVAFAIIGGILSAGDDDKPSASASVAADTDPTPKAEAKDDAPAEEKPEPKEEPKEEAPAKVVLKVWGDAPAGVSITYGSDTDSREGEWTGGKWAATLPLTDDAMYYHVYAQLQGGGDINCSVTVVGEETKKAHAAGGYNICNAQLSGDLLGGWS